MKDWEGQADTAKEILVYTAGAALRLSGGTQAAQAAAAGIDPSTVSRILAGDTENVSIERLLQILDRLGHDIQITVTPMIDGPTSGKIRVRPGLPTLEEAGFPDGALQAALDGGLLIVAPHDRVRAYLFAILMKAVGTKRPGQVYSIEGIAPPYYIDTITQAALSPPAWNFEAAIDHIYSHMKVDILAFQGMTDRSELNCVLRRLRSGVRTIVAFTAQNISEAFTIFDDEYAAVCPYPKTARKHLTTFKNALVTRKRTFSPDDPLDLKLVTLDSALIERADFTNLGRDVARQAYSRT